MLDLENLANIKDTRYVENLKKYLTSVLADKNVIGVVLFGSLARGCPKIFPESDIDLLIVARSLPADIITRRETTRKYKGGTIGIEDIWLTPEELTGGIDAGWGVLLDALADGIILHDPEGMLKTAKEKVSRYERFGKIWRIKKRDEERP